jgi:hypothetical protein
MVTSLSPTVTSWSATPAADAVAEFWVDNTGSVADNSTALNNAIAAAATGAFNLYIPNQPSGAPAVVLFQNPIVFGNGTSSTRSTQPGVGLFGSTHSGAALVVTGNAAGTADQFGQTIFRWNGAAGATQFVLVNGPIQGVDIEHITFDGTTNGPTRMLLLLSAQYCTFKDLASFGMAMGVHELGRTWTGTGVADSIGNRGERIFILLPGTAAGQSLVSGGAPNNSGTANMGMLHDGQQTSSNSCYGTWTDVWVNCAYHASSAGIYAAIFAWCDNITYKRF